MDPMPPMGSPVGRSPSEMSYNITTEQHPAQIQHLQQMQHQRHLNGPGKICLLFNFGAKIQIHHFGFR